jgi:hypothetical protein
VEEIPGQAGQNPILTSAAIVKARSRFSICLFARAISNRFPVGLLYQRPLPGFQGRAVLAFAFCRKSLQHSIARLAGGAGDLPSLRLVDRSEAGTLEAGRRLRVVTDPPRDLYGGLRLASVKSGLDNASIATSKSNLASPDANTPTRRHASPAGGPPVDVPFGSSNTFRSLLFAVCSSTINKAIEYILLNPIDHWFLVRTIPDSLNYQGDR